MTVVVLQGLPVRLFGAWEEQSDALLREYALDAAGPDQPFSLGDVARARNARITISNAVGRVGLQTAPVSAVNVSARLPHPVSPGDFSTLQAVLEDADRFARAGEFLTLPSLPEIVSLRNWVCDEAIAQAAGREPAAWNLQAQGNDDDAPLATWAGVADLPADAAWLVGDDRNRIIAASEPAVHLLQWHDRGIIGQRIIAVIPPALRETHVAAFTVATLTGEHRLLSQPLEVNAWTYHGDEIPITLTLERHPAQRGRAVYVAWLDTRDANP